MDHDTGVQCLTERLSTEIFEATRAEAGQPLTLRWHEGYDHGG
ncbi:MAG TPA: hypothetical protein VHM16_08305 [Rubrobacteraceae bacterium]|nr:hypothetical protein [Rubrobacteraceae bacterium]